MLSIYFDFIKSLFASSISRAPPPGTNLGVIITFLVTCIASWRFLSISFNTSFDAPLNKIEQAVGSLLSVIKVKYSSPIYFTSNKPAIVPTSES